METILETEGFMVKVDVDEKNRVTPKVAVKSPTEVMWGMAAGVLEESPKRVAREAVGKRSRLGR